MRWACRDCRRYWQDHRVKLNVAHRMRLDPSIIMALAEYQSTFWDLPIDPDADAWLYDWRDQRDRLNHACWEATRP